jgi:hypothetical protein
VCRAFPFRLPRNSVRRRASSVCPEGGHGREAVRNGVHFLEGKHVAETVGAICFRVTFVCPAFFHLKMMGVIPSVPQMYANVERKGGRIHAVIPEIEKGATVWIE